jgi:hypothetical protein
MAIERYLRTLADATSAELLNAARNVTIGIIGPSASGTPGSAATYTDLSTALTAIGTATTNGAYLPYLLKELYRVNDSQKVVVATTYNPGAFGGYTPTTISGGLAAGATTGIVASATGLANGDYVKMVDSASTPVEVFRKITISGTTLSFGALESALTGTITVTKLSKPTTNQINAARTAVGAVTGVELYVEIVEDATQLGNVKDFLEDREEEDIFTIGIVGELVGTTLPGATSATVTLAEGGNCKRLVYVAGDVTLTDSAVKAPAAAPMIAAVFADLKGKQRVKNEAALSFNDYPISNIGDYTAYTKADRTALTNGHVTVLVNKTIRGIASHRVYQMVTTYNEDSLGNPSTIYANMSDTNVEDLMRELVASDFDAWSADLTMAGDPLTTNSEDLMKMRGHVESLISTFSFVDRDFTNRVEVSSSSANAVQIKIIYKAVDVAHQIELVLVKNIRA